MIREGSERKCDEGSGRVEGEECGKEGCDSEGWAGEIAGSLGIAVCGYEAEKGAEGGEGSEDAGGGCGTVGADGGYARATGRREETGVRAVVGRATG